MAGAGGRVVGGGCERSIIGRTKELLNGVGGGGGSYSPIFKECSFGGEGTLRCQVRGITSYD